MTKLGLLSRVVLAAVLVAGLQGCFAVVVGGAAVGAFAATDRRTLGAQTEDKEIAGKANARLAKAIGEGNHVDVTSYNRKVLLTGEVRDEQTKQQAEQEVRQITGVQDVMNELDITFTSSVSSRSNDAYITTKVRAALVGERNLNSNAIEINTERGNVYLLGIVTQNEGQIAAQLAANVSGVQRVVKMFEYISDDQLKQMNALQGPRS
ncbi:MAG: BON domain-containing protein [Burkholderiaceae bacterium]|nr:BON domain-containing protein [Burkholderiaceae bacterium]